LSLHYWYLPCWQAVAEAPQRLPGRPAALGPAVPAAATRAPAPTATVAPTRAPAGLAELLKGAQGVSYKVAYKMTIGAGGQALATEMTVYSKPPKRRTDSSGMMGLGASSTYDLEDGSYICSGQGATGNCSRLPAGGERPPGQAPDDLMKNADTYETTPAGQRQVAGQSAQCFTMKPKRPGASITEAISCITSSGIQVYLQAKMAAGEMTMEATSVSTTVADADFQLPYPVGAAPQIPNLANIPTGQLPPGFPSGQLPPGIPQGQLPPGLPR